MSTSSASGSGDGGGIGGRRPPRPDPVAGAVGALGDPAGQGLPTLHGIVDIGDKARDDPPGVSDEMLTGYFDLSTELGALLHGKGKPVVNATFPTFAAWTTETLRIDVVPPDAQGKRPGGRQALRPGRWLYRMATDRLLGNNEIAKNLAEGEAMIYQETALALTTLVRTIRIELQKLFTTALAPPADEDAWWENSAKAWWQATWGAFTTTFTAEWANLQGKRTDPRDAEPDHSTLRTALEDAVLPYFRVLADGLTRQTDDDIGRQRQAELILLGTIRLEAYAQTRLQPVLERNLSFVPDALAAMVGGRVMGRTNRSTLRMQRLYERSRDARRLADEAFAIAATRFVFTLVIGNEVLNLGRNLPVAPPANPVFRDQQPQADQDRYGLGSFFPWDLQDLREHDLWTAWQQFDRSVTVGSRTATDDWLRYEERMSYVVNLFRSRQQVSALYDKPGSLPPRATVPTAPLAPVRPNVTDPARPRLAQAP